MSLPKSLTNYRQFLPSTHPRCKTQKHCNRKNFACNVASLLTTPHSGYHFDSTGRRFFEGWYFKVTLPGEGNAFALIYSIEDPAGGSPNGGVGAQVMGPKDSYLLQYTSNVEAFWAKGDALELGAVFSPPGAPVKSLLPQEEFDARVQQGYQASQSWHQGSLDASEAGSSGNLRSSVESAKWAFSVQPQLGWGEKGQKQRSTAGWLASLPVFEPHWQVMMAQGRASGWIEWGGERHEFKDAPAYAEKNWGGGFPKRWFWVQCDTFDTPTDQQIALTAVGAKRGLLNLPLDETVGLVGLHWGDRFFEFVPQNGKIKWQVKPWGSWKVTAENGKHRVVVEATCDRPGSPLLAPTADSGLSPLCKDSFFGKVNVKSCGTPTTWAELLLEVNVKLWETNSTGGKLLLEANSSRAAVEVGGGPWWDTWKGEAQMKEPLKSLIKLPVDVEGLSARLPEPLRPKGL